MASSLQSGGWQSTGRSERLIRLWSVVLPRRLDPWFPRLADALADGAWTAAWPRVTAYAPILAFILGFTVSVLLPFLGNPFMSEVQPRVWSELLPFMMLVAGAGFLLGTLGIGLVAGVVVGDIVRIVLAALLGGWQPWFRLGDNPLIAIVIVAGSALITYLLLAIPAVLLPIAARGIARRTLPRISQGGVRMAGWAITYIALAAILTFFWTRAVPLLIRPLYMWRSGEPAEQAITPSQLQWEWIVAAAVVGVLVRIALQEIVVRRAGAALVARLQAERASDPPVAISRRAQLAGLIVMAAGATLLLAGAYEHPIDPLVAAAAMSLFLVVRVVGVRNGPSGGPVERIPVVARLAVVVAVGYVLALVLAEAFWTTGSYRPVLIAALLIGAMFVLLFPNGMPRSGHVRGIAP